MGDIITAAAEAEQEEREARERQLDELASREEQLATEAAGIYLGELKVPLEKTPFAEYTTNDWIRFWVEKNHFFAGEHHQRWLNDQIMRIATGSEIILTMAFWFNCKSEDRWSLGPPTQLYKDWVETVPNYDPGIAP